VAKRQTQVIDKVIVNYSPELDDKEVDSLLKEEQVRAGIEKRLLLELDLTLSGDDVMIWPHYDSVRRVRRITGYLSTLPRFNDAKKEEEVSRISHIGERPADTDYPQSVVDEKYKDYLKIMIDENKQIDNEVIAEKLLQDGYRPAKIINAITRLSPDKTHIDLILVSDALFSQKKTKGKAR
jgi:anaerobic ribonucleoside-triphosphate reductase activating protein